MDGLATSLLVMLAGGWLSVRLTTWLMDWEEARTARHCQQALARQATPGGPRQET